MGMKGIGWNCLRGGKNLVWYEKVGWYAEAIALGEGKI